MAEITKLTGREYHCFDYYGAEDADRVIVAMGSVIDVVEETVDYLNSKGEKVGLVKVRLYRPFSIERLLNTIPDTVKKIAVLDKTKEPGSIGEPLYLDVVRAFYGKENAPMIVGGRFGLGSKDPLNIFLNSSFLSKLISIISSKLISFGTPTWLWCVLILAASPFPLSILSGYIVP